MILGYMYVYIGIYLLLVVKILLWLSVALISVYYISPLLVYVITLITLTTLITLMTLI